MEHSERVKIYDEALAILIGNWGEEFDDEREIELYDFVMDVFGGTTPQAAAAAFEENYM